MANVNLHLDPTVVLEIRRLRGQMLPSSSSEPVTLDNVNSFELRINWAQVAISTKTLSDLLNNYVFAYPGAPLKKIEASVHNGKIKMTGTMHKGIDMPFEIEGTLDVTPDGEIRMHASKVRSAHLPMKGLLHLFGEDLSKLINLKQDRGVRIDGDDIFLNPSRIMPPPRITTKVKQVQVEGDRIVQQFDSTPAALLALPYKARNYIYHRYGTLRFGKLTMHDADLEIVELKPHAQFEFDLSHYARQLVNGYSKTTSSQGLIVFMPGLNSSRSKSAASK